MFLYCMMLLQDYNIVPANFVCQANLFFSFIIEGQYTNDNCKTKSSSGKTCCACLL